MRRVLKTIFNANGTPQQIPVWRDYYTYTAGFVGTTTLAAGAELTDIINFETDSDFIWTKTTYEAYSANPASKTDSTLVVPCITVAINDSGTGRNLQQEAVPINCMAGRANLPYILPEARPIKGNSTVQFTFNNFSAAETYQYVRLQLHGYKEWR